MAPPQVALPSIFANVSPLSKLASRGNSLRICENRLVKKLAILGSTGSIGQSTLSICESFPERYEVVSLAAGRNLDEAFGQCLRWRPKVVSLATEELAEALLERLREAGLNDIEVLHGSAGSVQVATLPEVDFVVSAIVGVAGLEATYAAVCAGKTIGLANKECMVAAGEISHLKVLSGETLLKGAAVDAVKQWKYKPYLLNGEPVEIQTQITINFKLPH